MLAKLADWSSLAGLIVGAFGLAYSFLAYHAAKNAKQSADEARKDVRTIVAAERFQHLSSKASELFSHIEHNNLPAALFLARDLRFEINKAITRWEFLDPATKKASAMPAVLPGKWRIYAS